jgi:hypothetical protein
VSAPGLRVNPRTMPVQEATVEFEMLLLQFERARDLTEVEMLQILAGAQQRILKYMLRAERHPDDPDRKGDEE